MSLRININPMYTSPKTEMGCRRILNFKLKKTNKNRVVTTNFNQQNLSSNAPRMSTFISCRHYVRSLWNSLNASRQIPMSSDGHLVEETFRNVFDTFGSSALHDSVRTL